jgi:hypothetical protein
MMSLKIEMSEAQAEAVLSALSQVMDHPDAMIAECQNLANVNLLIRGSNQIRKAARHGEIKPWTKEDFKYNEQF